MTKPHNAVARGLEVSLRDVLQHQLLETQVRYQALQLRVLLLQLFQPPGLVHLQPAILTTPTVVRLLRDLRFLASLRSRLPVRDPYLYLTQQVHHLLRRMPLPSHGRRLVSSLYHSNWYKFSRADHQPSSLLALG
jgi:hypothetical protein